MDEGGKFPDPEINPAVEARLAGDASLGRSVTSVIDYAIVQLDRSGIIRAWNRDSERLKGYSPDEVMGKHFSIFYPPEDREIGLPGRILEEAHRDGRAEHAGWRVRKDGSRFWGEVIITAVRDDGNRLIGFVKVTRDLTDRHAIEAALVASEQRFRLLVDSVVDYAIIGLDPQGAIKTWNRGAERLKGYTVDEIVGLHFSTFYPEKDRASGLPLQILEEARTNGSAAHSGWRVRKDGSLFWGDVVVTALRAEADVLVGFVKVTRDLTERHEAERHVAEARDRAMRASQLKSEFIANTSHEIRTPMNGVIGMTDLLLRTSQTREQREYTLTVRNSAQALLTVINDILDFSKIEAGKLDLDQVDFDLREVVEEVAALLAGTAQTKGLELVTFVEPTVPRTLRGDPGRLRQVLLNLAGNAVKFTDNGEVLIHCELSDPGANGATVLLSEGSGALSRLGNDDIVTIRLSVRDTGPGITLEDQERLFSSFTQVDTSTTRRHGGTGLGLAIAKRLVELMGGDIGLESNPGKGSTFWFTTQLKVPPTAPRGTGGSLRGVPILVVDDNVTNRTILEQTLWSWEMEPAVAASATEALEKLRLAARQDRPFKIALIDYRMAEVDGVELARRMVGDDTLSNTHRVLLTSAGDFSGADEGLFEWSLTKPVRQSALLDCVIQHAGQLEVPDGEPSGVVDITASAAAKGLRVLVAEDNPVNQTVTRRMLETLGYEVDVVGNGAEAVSAVGDNRYAAVLMDCQMPGMDGYEATRNIRDREGSGRRLPIVAMTAGAMQGDAERCLVAGMDDYMSKPVALDRLESVIERWTVLDERTGRRPGDEESDDHREVLDLKVFDTLRELVGDRDNSFGDMVQLFVDNTSANLGALGDAMAQGHVDEAARRAHMIKGSAGILGARELAELCQLIMETAKRESGATLRPLYERTVNEFFRVRAVLGERVGSNESTSSG